MSLSCRPIGIFAKGKPLQHFHGKDELDGAASREALPRLCLLLAVRAEVVHPCGGSLGQAALRLVPGEVPVKDLGAARNCLVMLYPILLSNPVLYYIVYPHSAHVIPIFNPY